MGTKMKEFPYRNFEQLASELRKLRGFCRQFLLAAGIVLCFAVPALAVSPPSITPGTGSYLTQQSVSMSAAAGNIYYTLDGSTPDNNSTQYSAPIAVQGPTQVKAVAYSGGIYSTVTTAYLDVDESLVPVLEPTGLTLRVRSSFGVETDSGTTPPVNTWVDLSGNNNSATGSSSTRPTLESDALNGLPALNFNSSQYLSLPSGFANFTNGASLFIVTSPTQLTANSTVFDLGTDLRLATKRSHDSCHWGLQNNRQCHDDRRL